MQFANNNWDEMVSVITKQNEKNKEMQKKIDLRGKQFVITGKLQRMTREQAHESIERYGGHFKSQITRSTDYLVTGADTGTLKIQKAKELNITVLTEKDFIEMLSGQKMAASDNNGYVMCNADEKYNTVPGSWTKDEFYYWEEFGGKRLVKDDRGRQHILDELPSYLFKKPEANDVENWLDQFKF